MTKNSRGLILTGGFKELLFLFFPILLMTFSNSLFLIVEKLLLARLSVESMEAAVSSAYACQIFQIPCVALTMMAQVCVGRWRGANELSSIGPGVWQFIWFSLLSMLIVIPAGIVYGDLYFKGTNVEHIVKPYYYLLVCFNFFYPLTTTLTCFYLGQGKTFLVVVGTITSQTIKLILAYLLIFGWGNWIPEMGLIGGAISTLIAQGGFCIILFWVFINQENTRNFLSRNWHFRPRLFWECIHPGTLRAINRILSVFCWASTAHLMSIKGGDYILILSIGGTICLFLPFVGDAICQAQTTIVSHILGAKKYVLMNKAFRSGSLLVLITLIIMAPPFLIFPIFTFKILFPSILMNEITIQNMFRGIWISLAFLTFGYIPTSYVLAFKDTKFSLFMGVFSWFNGFLMMYVAIEKIQIPADQFWLVLSIMHGTNALLYYWRMKWLQAKAMSPEKSLA